MAFQMSQWPALEKLALQRLQTPPDGVKLSGPGRNFAHRIPREAPQMQGATTSHIGNMVRSGEAAVGDGSLGIRDGTCAPAHLGFGDIRPSALSRPGNSPMTIFGAKPGIAPRTPR